MNDTTLLHVKFSAGTVTYWNDFTVSIEGRVWPRELEAAHLIIGIYKEQHKQSAGVKKSAVPPKEAL